MMHRDTPQTSLPTHVTDSRGSKLLLQLIRNPARVPLKVGGPEGGGWVPPPPPLLVPSFFWSKPIGARKKF